MCHKTHSSWARWELSCWGESELEQVGVLVHMEVEAEKEMIDHSHGLSFVNSTVVQESLTHTSVYLLTYAYICTYVYTHAHTHISTPK